MDSAARPRRQAQCGGTVVAEGFLSQLEGLTNKTQLVFAPMGKAILKVLSLAALAAMVGCSPRYLLTRRLAFDLISSSAAMHAPQPLLLRTGLVSNKDYVSTDYMVLRRYGWISAAPAKCVGEVAPPPCWQVALTPAGVGVVNSLIPSAGTDQELFELPLAKRQVVAITGISKEGNNAEVEFVWRWSAMNEVGTALYPPDLRYKSVVAFRYYDDGWRLVESPIRGNQTIDDALKSAEPAP